MAKSVSNKLRLGLSGADCGTFSSYFFRRFFLFCLFFSWTFCAFFMKIRQTAQNCLLFSIFYLKMGDAKVCERPQLIRTDKLGRPRICRTEQRRVPNGIQRGGRRTGSFGASWVFPPAQLSGGTTPRDGKQIPAYTKIPKASPSGFLLVGKGVQSRVGFFNGATGNRAAGTRLKYRSLSTMLKKDTKNQAPPEKRAEMKLCSKFKGVGVQSPNILAVGLCGWLHLEKSRGTQGGGQL